MKTPEQIEADYRDDYPEIHLGSGVMVSTGHPRYEDYIALGVRNLLREQAAASRKIWPTVADFYSEFSTAEQYLIQASSVPAVVIARGQLAMWRGEVWSDDARIVAGMDALVEAAIITTERKTEILTP